MARNQSEKEGPRHRVVHHPNQGAFDLRLIPALSDQWVVALYQKKCGSLRESRSFKSYPDAAALFDATPPIIWWPDYGEGYGWPHEPPAHELRLGGTDGA